MLTTAHHHQRPAIGCMYAAHSVSTAPISSSSSNDCLHSDGALPNSTK
jgi:hypothetical protein